MKFNKNKKFVSGVEHRIPLTLRVPAYLKADLKKMAKELNRSSSAQATVILEEAVRSFADRV